MNQRVAMVNFDMKIGPVNVAMKCIDSESRAAYYNTISMVTAASLVAMTLY